MAKNDLEALERELTSYVDKERSKKEAQEQGGEKGDLPSRRGYTPQPRLNNKGEADSRQNSRYRPSNDENEDDDDVIPSNQPSARKAPFQHQQSPQEAKRYNVKAPPSFKSSRMNEAMDDEDALYSKDVRLDEDPLPHDESGKSGPSMIVIAAIASLVVIVGLALWYVYNQGVISGSETAAPTLRLDGPIKMQPDSPGSSAVSQNNELFERIDGIDDNQDNVIPNVQDNVQDNMPDDPMVRGAQPQQSQLVQQDNTPPPPSIAAPEAAVASAFGIGDAPPQSNVEAPTAGEAQTTTQSVDNTQASFSPPTTPITTSPENAPVTSENNNTQIIPAEANQVDEPPLGNIPASGTGWRIQIAALPSLDEARSYWQNTRAKFPGVLNGLNFSTEIVTVNDQQYHRARGGPLPNRQTAERICNTLKAQGQACIIVKP